MTNEQACFHTPVGTKLVPNGSSKTSNSVILSNIEEVELARTGNAGGSGGSYGAALIRVKITAFKNNVNYTTHRPYSSIQRLHKGDVFKVNPLHFKLGTSNYPIF